MLKKYFFDNIFFLKTGTPPGGFSSTGTPRVTGLTISVSYSDDQAIYRYVDLELSISTIKQNFEDIFGVRSWFMSETTRNRLGTPPVATQSTAIIPERPSWIQPKKVPFLNNDHIGDSNLATLLIWWAQAYLTSSPRTFKTVTVFFTNDCVFVC